MIRTLILLVSAVCYSTSTYSNTSAVTQPTAQRCQALEGKVTERLSVSPITITEATWHAHSQSFKAKSISAAITLPPHCEVYGEMDAHTGVDGQSYAIKFHIRLPQTWNRRFLFQGGGGSNGNVGEALGILGVGKPTAIEQGFAVVTQDSGHDNEENTIADKNGELAFGFDPIARANYGGASLAPVAVAAKQIISSLYGNQPDYAYFNGCSKGGQEGMMFAQRYSDVFDGIIAKAPGFALPRAALSQVWDSRAFATTKSGSKDVTLETLRTSFTNKQLQTIKTSILEVCDAADGIEDGMTSNFAACDDKSIIDALNDHLCGSDKSDQACLTPLHISNLTKAMHGPEDSEGNKLYARWAWDAGIGQRDWRVWKLGTEDGSVPSLNFILGAKALASVFTTPPTVIGDAPEDISAFIENFSFDVDAQRIYAVAPPYQNSPWHDVGARDADLAAFKAHGAKMIVPHGVADPVFSVLDTIAWYNEVDRKNNGKANEFVRVFAVPGMGHCSGGPTVEVFDAFSSLMDWVENDVAPDQIHAVASDKSPWPGRERPLCPYPQYAKYKGKGDPEKVESFKCVSAQ